MKQLIPLLLFTGFALWFSKPVYAQGDDGKPGACLTNFCSYALCDTCLTTLPYKNNGVGKDLGRKYGK